MPQVPLPRMGRQVGIPQSGSVQGIQPTQIDGSQQAQQLGQASMAAGMNLVKIGSKIRGDRDHLSASDNLLKLKEAALQFRKTGYGATIGEEALPTKDGGSPRLKALGELEGYRKSLEEGMTPQARDMMHSAAGAVYLSAQEFGITHELSNQKIAQKASAEANMANTMETMATQATDPDLDEEARAAIEFDEGIQASAMGSEGGASASKIRDEKRAERAALGLPEDRRTAIQKSMDTVISIAVDSGRLNGVTPGSEEEEVVIRNARTAAASVVVAAQVSASQLDRATVFLDSIPPGDMKVGTKGALRETIKKAAAGLRTKADLEKGFNVGLTALNNAKTKPSPSGLPLSPAEKLNLAKANIEKQKDAGTITYPQYVAARNTIRDEFADLEREDVESGNRMVTELFERFPDITSLDDPRLAESEKQAFRSNYTAMSTLEGNRVSQISQGSVAAMSNASKRVGEKGPSYNMRSFGGRAAWRAATSGSEIANKDFRAILGDIERYNRAPLAMLGDFKDENGNPSFKKFSKRFMAFTGKPKEAWDEAKRLWDIANKQHSAGSKEFDVAGEKALKEYFQDFGSLSRFEFDKDGVTLVRTNDLKPQVLAAGLDALRKASGEALSGGLSLSDMHAFLNSETNKSFLIIDHVSLADRKIPSWLGGMTQAGRAGTGFEGSTLRYLSRKGAPLFTNAEEGSGRYQQGMGTVKLGVIAEDAMAYLVGQAKNNPALKAEFLAAGGGDETSGIFNYVYDMLDIVRKDPKWEKDFGKDFKLENGNAVKALRKASKLSQDYAAEAAAQPRAEVWSVGAVEAFGGHINPDTGMLGANLTGKNIESALDKLEDKEEGLRYAKWLQTWKRYPSAEGTTADLQSLDETIFELQRQRSNALLENTGFHSVEEIEESIKEDRGFLGGLDQKYMTEKKRALYEEYRVLTADMEDRQKKWDDETKALEKLVAGRDTGDHAYPRAYAIRTAKLKKQLAVRKKSAMPKDARNVAKIEALKKAAGGTEVSFGSDRWGSYTGTGEGFPDIAKRRMDPETVMELYKQSRPIREGITVKKDLINQFRMGKGDYSNKDLIAIYTETLEVAKQAMMNGHSFQSGKEKTALNKIIESLKKSLRENDTDASVPNPAFMIKQLMEQEGFKWKYVPTATDLRTGGN